MNRIPRVQIVLICLGLTLVASYRLVASANDRGLFAQAQDSQPVESSVAVSRLGNLTLSVTGSGQLASLSQANLGFPLGGTLTSLNIKVGQSVQAGQVLAHLQTRETPARHDEALASVQLALVNAQIGLDRLTTQAEKASAQALIDFETAQKNLSKLADNSLQRAQAMQVVAQAQQAVDDARFNLALLTARPSEDAMQIAHDTALFKEKELHTVQVQVARLVNRIKRAPNPMIRDMLKQQLLDMNLRLIEKQIAYETALSYYQHINDPPDPTELVVAQAKVAAALAQLTQAQLDLQEAQAGPSPAELAQAEAQLIEAQTAWERRKAGPDAPELAIAKAGLAKARAELAVLKEEKLEIDLLAPYDGIITALDAAVGDNLNGGAILTLADMSHPIVETYLDETDLAGVEPGIPVSVVFDALPEDTFSGKVIQISPSLIESFNSSAILVIVQLDKWPGTGKGSPMLGLNATVELVTGQVQNVVLVPMEAIYQDPAGKTFVFVQEGGAFQKRPVTIGLTDATTAEITNGLAPGVTVAIENLDTLAGEQ